MSTDKRRWRRVDGVLLLDKPTGLSSNDALQKARRLFSAEKGGHTGTLDPMASGLLPLCFGEATKFSADLLDADKTYRATLRLGERTDTGDAEGEIVERRPLCFEVGRLPQAIAGFFGPQMQVPPMHSALKRDGVPLYRIAREGRTVEREPRPVTIHAIELLTESLPDIEIRVTCSKGTYVRVLAEDIGEALGCGAHLVALRRERVGALDIADAVTLDTLARIDESAREACLLPVDTLLGSLPAIKLSASDAERFGNGNPVCMGTSLFGKVRVYHDTNLLGLGQCSDDGILSPKRLIRRPAD